MLWWMSKVRQWNHKGAPESYNIESNASHLGWGALANQTTMGGLWSPRERELHINMLELMVGTFANKTFAKGKKDLHICLMMDNTSTVAYVNHMGGTQSSVCQTSLALVSGQENNNLSGVPPRGEQHHSRFPVTGSLHNSKWRLDPAVFEVLAQRLGPCKVDLFATHLNAQLEK